MQYLQRHAGGVVVFRNALDSSFILPDYARLTRPSLWSAIVQESIKVWAMTKSTASTWSEVCTLKMNCGFFRMLIQNRSGKLFLGETITCIGSIKRKTNHQPSSSVNCTLLFIYLFILTVAVTSLFSKYGSSPGRWCCAAGPAHPTSRKSIWQPEGRDDWCWGWPWINHPQTSAVCPDNESSKTNVRGGGG